jgi:hypothetical protein
MLRGQLLGRGAGKTWGTLDSLYAGEDGFRAIFHVTLLLCRSRCRRAASRCAGRSIRRRTTSTTGGPTAALARARRPGRVCHLLRQLDQRVVPYYCWFAGCPTAPAARQLPHPLERYVIRHPRARADAGAGARDVSIHAVRGLSAARLQHLAVPICAALLRCSATATSALHYHNLG